MTPGTTPKRVVATLLAALSLAGAVACGTSADGADESTAAAASGERERLRRFWETYRAATAARTRGDAAAAIPLYREVLDVDPEHGDSLHFLAQLLYARGDVAGARELLVRLTEADPRSPRGWQQLSVLQGMPVAGWVAAPEAALESIRKAVQRNPSNSGALALRARWAAHAGRWPESHEALAAALELNRGNAEAQAVQAWLEDRDAVHPASLPGRLQPLAGARAAPQALIATLDLDDDGTADLRVAAAGVGDPAVLLARSAAGEIELPAATAANGWDGHAWADVKPAVWRAAFLDGPRGIRLALVGGGGEPLRLFESTASGAWRRTPTSGLPAELHGSVMAAADVDGDGLTDLLVGNVPDSGGDAPGVWLADREGGFGRAPLVLPANATAALLADIDDDGFTDLLLGLAPPLLPAVAGAEEEDDTFAAVELWLGSEHGLQPAVGRLPATDTAVVDLGLASATGAREIYLATGGLRPGSTVPDLLWRWDGERLVDVSEELGPRRFGATVRVLSAGGPSAGGPLRLLRGGLVPGNPRRELLLRPR